MTNKQPLALFIFAYAIMIFFISTLRVSAAEPEVLTDQDSTPDSATSAEVLQLEDLPGLAGGTKAGAVQDGPVLKDVSTVEQGGQTLLVKTWDVAPTYNADELVEADFEKGGIHYKKAYLLQVSENYDNQTKLASETVTVAHDSRDDVMAKLQPLMDYNQDGYTGQLTLQAEAIVTEAVGRSSYTYAISDVREYPGLERNDPYNVPKSVEKEGATLQMVDVKWSQSPDGTYTATASYSGSATGSKVTGYTSTATYLGEVKKEVLDSITYAVVYEGSLIPPPPFDFSPYVVAGGGAVLLLAALLIFLNKRDNTKIYAMIGREYQLVHKQKLTSLAPIIDLSPQEISGQSEEFMVTLDRIAVRKLRGHTIKIIGKDGMMKEHRVYKIRQFYIGQRYGDMEEAYDE